MDRRIAFAVIGLCCAGCTQDPRSAAPEAAVERTGAVAGFGWSARPASLRSFASAPDRGDLVAYPARRVVTTDGAYTWHRADLSEDHALRAIGGVMQVTTPAGGMLRFQYQRHVEHPSGDWTWIGRALDGPEWDDVVLTFGTRAAYGSIAQPGQAPLKLTMSRGVSWLVETDRAKIAAIDNDAARPKVADFLIPPRTEARSGSSMASPKTAASSATVAASEQSTATATTTIDLVLGYTGGFAAAQGGQAQAVTRLYNIVEITNQAYVNSQVDVRVRLVHSVQVGYPDTTPILGTLEALTGFRWPNTRTTPDPAFAELRWARNHYGADLVSLVRTAQNDACGLAWLIGGGLAGVKASDEYFGYSVVSDGSKTAPGGNSYFCREETLAHELGHNMGSQHERAAATVGGTLQYGAYPYSFGQKAFAGWGNFYTVMAFGDSGQTLYRVFSNPRVALCGGYPCGVADQADNARSLGQTTWVIAGFRATVVPYVEFPEANCRLPPLSQS